MIARSPLRLAALTVGFGLAMSSASHAAAYIKFDGIDGEATARGHEKWIELESWSFGASQAGAAGPAAQRLANSAVPPPGAGAGALSLVKRRNTSTAQLSAAVAAGRRIPEAILHVSAPGGGQTYLEYKLENVLISSIAPAAGGNTLPTESMSLNYGRVRTTATPVTVGLPLRAP